MDLVRLNPAAIFPHTFCRIDPDCDNRIQHIVPGLGMDESSENPRGPIDDALPVHFCTGPGNDPDAQSLVAPRIVATTHVPQRVHLAHWPVTPART